MGLEADRSVPWASQARPNRAPPFHLNIPTNRFTSLDMMKAAKFFLIFLVLAGLSIQAAGSTEIRCLWVTRWAFRSEDDLQRILSDAAQLGFTDVFLQVRGECDALYASGLEPWAEPLTGTLGEDPGWDPLKTAIEIAGKYGLRLHAWINVLTAWHVSKKGTPPSLKSHIFLSHPEWILCNRHGKPMSIVRAHSRSNYAFLNPASPARNHIIEVVKDIVSNYAIDGLHLDYIRFPDTSYAYPSPELKGAVDLDDDSLRAESITTLIRAIREVVRTRHNIVLSATVLPNLTYAKSHCYQDATKWVERGLVDFVVPICYTSELKSFRKFLTRYVEALGRENVVAGIGCYLEDLNDIGFLVEIEIARKLGVKGVAIFNSACLTARRQALAEAFGEE